ncbi:MAG: discoidin domain-containing protein, partial [Phycisphaeraceae bacterium]|nr:discoidin domain-containing protein [Phycisphaeraceae bacterium]
LDPWIQYEFDEVKKLDVMTVWNSNGAAESAIGWGVKDVEIATSVDGETWDVLADVSQFSRAPGRPTYREFDTIDFEGVAAKYVRLNIQSNWGGILMSYGLSEVQFSMIPVRVRTPEPAFGSMDLAPDTVATWRAGRDADHHLIYVSTDMSAVADGTAPSVTSNTNRLDMTSLDLQLGQTYYWHVDEVNETEAVTLWAGDVWNFSTVPYLTIDDFEGYSNISPDRPFQTWLDGFGYSADEFFPAGYGGNGTGAGIGHDIWSLSSPHYNGNIMETVNTAPGSDQSMPFYYTNSGGVASQTERPFKAPQDWTIGGAKTLSIAFNGQAGNTGTMFVIINNEKVTYQRDIGNISRGAWQAWNVDLSTVNTALSDITKLTLGVEGAGASGMILFDDIRVFAKAGEILTPVDPGTNGLVGAWSFDEGSGSTAIDGSGHGRNGTLVDATWDTGIQGSALSFNGASSYVNIDDYKGINAIDAVQQAFTISNWIKTTSGEGEMVTWGTSAARQRLTWRINADTLRTEHADGNLRGNTPVNDDEWHHVALVVTEGANLTVPATQIYLDGVPDGTFSGSANPYELTADVDVRIGMGGPTGGRFFTGLIDDVLIFDRALSDAELLWLAGRTEAIDKPF